MKHFKCFIPIILLSVILLLGMVIRFYHLGSIPSGFHRDEAYLGYNAYSILKTGRDMTGNFLPLHIPSFLYCPGGYSYLSIPVIAIFGLSPFSVRFVSAFYGSLTILATYLLVLSLFKFSKFQINQPENLSSLAIALLSSLFLAITPWHINLSRTATENTIVVFFITLGTYTFLEYIYNKRQWLLFITFLCYAITLTLYQAPRAFLPMFIPLLVAAFINNLSKQQLGKLFLIFFITIIIPLILILKSPQLATRIRTVSLFATPGTQLVVNEYIREDGTLPNNTNITRFFHNKPVAYIFQGVRNYFSHWTYDFLFTDEILPMRYRIPGGSNLYLAFLPLMALGVIYLLTIPGPIPIFLLGWLILAPIGSSLTFDDIPNIQRTLIVFPALSIVTAFGTVYAFERLKKISSWVIFPTFIFLLLFLLYNTAQYFHAYYIQQLVHRPWYRHEGYQELVSTVNTMLSKNPSQFKRAIITNSESAPTIFFLFFGKYNPNSFQNEIRDSKFTSYDRIDFSKYSFTVEECPFREYEEIDKITLEKRIVTTGKPGLLYVNYGICKEPKQTGNIIKTIKRNDQTPVFQIISLKKHQS